MGSTISMAFFGYGMMLIIAVLCAVLIRVIVMVLARAQDARKRAAPTPVAVSVTPARDETAAHVAAVAAAVYAVVGAHRLIHIGRAASGTSYAAFGRSQHQTSHTPRLDHH